MTTVGVIGLGTVGGTVIRAFEEAGIATRGYDRYLGIGSPVDLAACGVVFLCVPTPTAPVGRHDLKEVWAAVKEIAPYLGTATIVATKSTVPPGTCDLLAAEFSDLEFASVPEFMVSARAMETFTRADRVVIGSPSNEAATILTELMSRVAPTAPVLVVRPLEAELIKLCSNAMLAAKVTMANELAEVCARFGALWPRVQAGVGLDRRIGPDHLTLAPERGFGGSCLPKDLDGLIAASRQLGYEAPVLRAIADFNRAIRKVEEEKDKASAPAAHS
jgi:UDPglucose 6-dehydrogenase